MPITSLPLQETAIAQAHVYLEAFRLLISNTLKLRRVPDERQDDHANLLIRMAKDALLETEKNIDKITLSTPPTQDEMDAINIHLENYGASLVDLFANSTLEKGVDNLEKSEIVKWLKSAENLVNWQTRSEIQTHYQEGGIEKTLIEKPVYRFTENLVNEYLSIRPSEHHKPTWFTELPQWEQKELQSRVIKAKQAAEATGEEKSSSVYQKAFAESLGTPPSALRRYPGLANYSEHRQILKKNGEVISDTTYYRAATPAPFNIKDAAERQRLTTLAIEQFKQNHPDAGEMLGFVTPILGTLEHRIANDNAAAATAQHIHYAIRPLNKTRGLVPGETQVKKDEITTAVINHALDHLEALKTNYPDQKTPLEKVKNSLLAWHTRSTPDALATLQNDVSNAIEHIKRTKKPLSLADRDALKFLNILKDYAELLQKAPHTGHDRNPNLWRAAYEEMILNALYGCRSNKDRAGMFTLQLDAMEEVFAATGRLPKFDDTGMHRDTFNKAYATEFLSGHHNRYAELNTKGAQALKSVRDVLAKDTQAMILEKAGTLGKGASIFDQHKSCSARNKFSFKRKEVKKLPDKLSLQTPLAAQASTQTASTPVDTRTRPGLENPRAMAARPSEITIDSKPSRGTGETPPSTPKKLDR